jgi:hypothetical protein
MLIQFWSFFEFVYISEKGLFFIDFHVLALPGSSRRPLRKISTGSPDFELGYYNLMPFIYSQTYFSWKTNNSCPQTFLGQQLKKPDQFANTFLDT